MSYNKLNLSDGQTFKAEHLSHIEQGIADANVTVNSESSTSITLANNMEFRRGTISTLNINLPTGIPEQFNCSVAFTSGSTATNVTLPSNIALLHTKDEFTADANTRYNLLFWSDGELIWCSVASKSV